MPDIQQPHFEKSAYEEDLARAEQEVRRAKERPDPESIGDRQIVKNAITVLTGAPVPAAPIPVPATQSLTGADRAEVAHLLEMAKVQGIVKAAAAAAASSPFVADAFHDALAEEVHDDFRKRGILP